MEWTIRPSSKKSPHPWIYHNHNGILALSSYGGEHCNLCKKSIPNEILLQYSLLPWRKSLIVPNNGIILHTLDNKWLGSVNKQRDIFISMGENLNSQIKIDSIVQFLRKYEIYIKKIGFYDDSSPEPIKIIRVSSYKV